MAGITVEEANKRGSSGAGVPAADGMIFESFLLRLAIAILGRLMNVEMSMLTSIWISARSATTATVLRWAMAGTRGKGFGMWVFACGFSVSRFPALSFMWETIGSCVIE